MHWSDAGAASWYDVAVAIGSIGQSLGLLNQPARVEAISTADYPTAAIRPSYSLLDCFGTRAMLQLPGQHWREALQDIMRCIAKASTVFSTVLFCNMAEPILSCELLDRRRKISLAFIGGAVIRSTAGEAKAIVFIPSCTC